MTSRDLVRYKRIDKSTEIAEFPSDETLHSGSSTSNEVFIQTGESTEHLSKPQRLASVSSISTKCRNFLFICLVVITFFTVSYFLITSHEDYDRWKDYFIDRIINNNPYPTDEWSIEMPIYGTESCIRLVDINEDGLDDIIFGLASTSEINRQLNSTQTMHECGGNELSPQCQGLIYGMRGYDGKILWKLSTKSEVFLMNCHQIDIDLDGKFDCVAAGRRKTFLAFNPRTGKQYWQVDNDYFEENWNFYNPVIVERDLNNDGVREIIIAHGGNPAIPSSVREREAGRIFLIDGKTGRQIGDYFKIPNEKETYMSPVLHGEYLLLGSGGETVPGCLYAISINDFVFLITADYMRKNVADNVTGLITLYESKLKGVMVPPVLVDVTKDGIDDILMSAFDGTLTLFDGKTLKPIWSKVYPCHETYTSPAPGYFNDDDTIDFMIAQNEGAFEFYHNSKLFVLNGLDGSILWELEGNRMQMISPLTIQTLDTNRDFYFFRMQGVESNLRITQQVYHGIDPQQPIIQSPRSSTCPDDYFDENGNDQKNYSVESFKPRCENFPQIEDYLSTYGILVDRSTSASPLIVFQAKPTQRMYDFNEEDMKQLGLVQTSKLDTICVLMEPMERNTGAIGDLDGDSYPDIVTIVTRAGTVTHNNQYLKVLTQLTLNKNNVRETLRNNRRLKNSDNIIKVNLLDSIDNNNERKNERNLKDLRFAKNQTWNAYMGRRSDSKFDLIASIF